MYLILVFEAVKLTIEKEKLRNLYVFDFGLLKCGVTLYSNRIILAVKSQKLITIKYGRKVEMTFGKNESLLLKDNGND